MAANNLGDLITVMLSAYKDKVYLETTEKMQAAFHELILTEAASRRDKVTALIRAMAKIDAEVIRFKREYSRISNQLTPEAITAIEDYLKIVEQKKKDIIHEKNAMKTRR
jgi:hypothetical protein